MLEVEPTGQRGRTATRPSLAQRQKHSLGGSTVDMLQLTAIGREYRLIKRYLV